MAALRALRLALLDPMDFWARDVGFFVGVFDLSGFRFDLVLFFVSASRLALINSSGGFNRV